MVAMEQNEKKIEFSHRSVLLDECIEGLAINPDGVYVDGTAGGGQPPGVGQCVAAA